MTFPVTDRVPRRPPRAERGAILVQVAVALIGLIGFSSFVVDYGVLWTARRQAQNAADAAALAAAAAYGYGGGDEALARAAAIAAAQANLVWGEPPDITGGDVTFTTSCPAGAPEAGGGRCVRVDVFRNQQRGNPLPAILGGVVGITEQGVRATANAEVLYGNRTSCVKPLAILDRWAEAGSPPWEPNGDTFDRYAPPPAVPGTLLANPDSYVGPTAGNNGTGLDLALDHGRQVILARRQDGYPDSTSWYFPVQFDCPGEAPGSIACFMANVTGCSPQAVGAGDTILAHAGGFVGVDGINYLVPALGSVVAGDAGAYWEGAANGGLGGVAGGCMANGTCSVSPRIIAVPAIDPDVWSAQGTYPPHDHPSVNITRLVGLFIEQANGTEIVGRLMAYPSLPNTTDLGVPGAAFVVSTLLVR